MTLGALRLAKATHIMRYEGRLTQTMNELTEIQRTIDEVDSGEFDDILDLPPMFIPPVMLVRQALGQSRQA